MKRLMLVLVAVTSCACGRDGSVAGPGVLTDGVLTVVKAASSETPTPAAEPTAIHTSAPTEEPTEEPTVDPLANCPTVIPQSTWTAPSTYTLTGTHAHIRCERPAVASEPCALDMGYAWSHETRDGYFPIQHGEFTSDGGMNIDSTVFPNGPLVLYCAPFMWNGLWYPNPAEIRVTVANYPND